MKELYIDASRGLAGDMLCAALLELFDEPEKEILKLNAIGLPGVIYRLERTISHSISGSRLHVEIDGGEEGDRKTIVKSERNLTEIGQIVDGLRLTDALKNKIRAIYQLIAEAEATVHGTEIGLVHFHELGAMDAVADISAACFLIDALGVSRVTVSPVTTGFGSVMTAHGMLPVPAPATARLLNGVPCSAGDIEAELCTPTGAALARYFAAAFCPMPMMKISAQGLGLGKKDFGQLSCVRVFLGETEESIIELCCNVDDMSPEAVGFALEELMRGGAVDTWYEPIGMKKNRPGLLLCCLCHEQSRDEIVRLIFKHTSTIGIRETLCRRYVLKRNEEVIDTVYGPVRQKMSSGYGVERRKEEFDDLARIARIQDLSLRELEEKIHES